MLTACFANGLLALLTAITSAAPALCAPRVPEAELLAPGDSHCPLHHPGQGLMETRVPASSPRCRSWERQDLVSSRKKKKKR